MSSVFCVQVAMCGTPQPAGLRLAGACRWGHRGCAPQKFHGGRMAKVVIETAVDGFIWGFNHQIWWNMVELKCQICFFKPSNGDRAGK